MLTLVRTSGGLFTPLLFLLLCAQGCNQRSEDSQSTQTALALTAVDAGTQFSGSMCQNRPGDKPIPRLPAPPPEPAVNPAHFRNKIINKPPLDFTKAPATAPPGNPAYIAKQNQYIAQWQALQPTIATLPLNDQNARREALKRAVLGE